MAIRLHYFDYFPNTLYDIDGTNEHIDVTNIMHRFRLREILKNKAVLYHTYEVRSNERPEHVAKKFYGRAKLDWLILITNEMLDPHFDWPMNHWQFQDFVIAKYGSLSDAHQTVHHYERIVTAEQELSSGKIVPEYNIWIDQTEYSGLPDEERRSVSMYEYEKELNEERRIIKVVNETYLPQILRETEAIFTNTV